MHALDSYLAHYEGCKIADRFFGTDAVSAIPATYSHLEKEGHLYDDRLLASALLFEKSSHPRATHVRWPPQTKIGQFFESI